MTTRRLSCLAIALTALTGAIAGCTGRDRLALGHEPANVKPPPGYHPAGAVPVDPDLQASARRKLDAALRSPDEVVRAHALEALAEVAPADPDPLVLPRLSDPSLLVRKAAALTAGRLKLAAAHDRLLALATDVPATAPADQPGRPTAAYQARMAAVFGLHQLGDTRYSHQLELAAIDPRPQVRGDAALLLGLIGNTSAEPMLVQMLKHDRNQNVRLQAAEALWRMKNELGENFLIPATLSGYTSDNMIALMALAGPRDPAVLGHVQGFLSYEDHPEIRLAAARAAGQLQCDWGVGVAEQSAKAGDPNQRALAALALGDIGRTDTQPTLANLLSDPAPDVRVAAAAALLQIGRR